MKKITELTAELAAPAIAEQGCTLWDVEYVKEAGTWYLRILLDKEVGNHSAHHSVAAVAGSTELSGTGHPVSLLNFNITHRLCSA